MSPQKNWMWFTQMECVRYVWLLCLIILMPPSLPLYFLVCWIPRYRAARSHWYVHLSPPTNYITVIISQSQERMLAQQRQLTEWYGHQTTSRICKKAFTTSTEFNTSFSGTLPSSLLKLLLTSNRCMFYYTFCQFADSDSCTTSPTSGVNPRF